MVAYVNSMVHSHGPEALLIGTRPPQCIMNHHGYGYYNHILDCILCYPILMVNSHYTVPDYLALALKISGKILGSVGTIIYGVVIHWHSYTHGLPLKLDIGNDDIFRCE